MRRRKNCVSGKKSKRENKNVFKLTTNQISEVKVAVETATLFGSLLFNSCVIFFLILRVIFLSILLYLKNLCASVSLIIKVNYLCVSCFTFLFVSDYCCYQQYYAMGECVRKARVREIVLPVEKASR